MDMFRKSLEKSEDKISIDIQKEEHDFIRKAIVAGRSEAINGPMKVNKKVVIADIKSLYPSVAGLCGNESKILGFKTYYPIGKTTWVKK